MVQASRPTFNPKCSVGLAAGFVTISGCRSTRPGLAIVSAVVSAHHGNDHGRFTPRRYIVRALPAARVGAGGFSAPTRRLIGSPQRVHKAPTATAVSPSMTTTSRRQGPAPQPSTALDSPGTTKPRPLASASSAGNENDPRWVVQGLLKITRTDRPVLPLEPGCIRLGKPSTQRLPRRDRSTGEAFFYGSSTQPIDHRRQNPASLWVMALSVRFFGLNSWSILSRKHY